MVAPTVKPHIDPHTRKFLTAEEEMCKLYDIEADDPFLLVEELDPMVIDLLEEDDFDI
jgi:hypothetical protein